jgi:uncharacterized protein
MRKKIDQDFKEALKQKNEIMVSALRNLKAEIKNVEIAKGKELSDEEILDVVAKKVKQHKDSIESFKSGGRADLVETEQKQMEVLSAYMPAQMTEDEVDNVVKEVITSTNATSKDFGKVMKEVMSRCKGKTDGSVVSKLVKKALG